MRKYPIGIQDFRELIEGGYVYVDKTPWIHRLVETGKYYFLSRPRRFGKSLLLSTIKYLFEGEQKLFKGLWIEQHYDWETHPVIHISFSSTGYNTLGLTAAIHKVLDDYAQEFGIQLENEAYDQKFAELLKKISTQKKKVVLLVDEYDKPIVDYIEDVQLAKEHRDILKTFYSVLKDADKYLKLFLITGVSKFSKVSLFSDLNHLDDISLVSDFAAIAGYTQAEVDTYFEKEMLALAQQEERSFSQIKEKVKWWYNGYRWYGDEAVYNPFSMLRLFRHQRFANFWWETGTPSFLINQLKKGFHFSMESLEVGSDVFESYTIENLEWRSLLFQTGYLTIHHYHKEDRLYTLGYPNLEVRDAMYRHLLGAFRETEKSESQALFVGIKRALEEGKLEQLIEKINLLFSTIPHQIFLQKQEAFFHAILHITFSAVDLLIHSEVSTSKGRLDTIVHTASTIYIIEFKLDGSAQAALNQIRQKKYGDPYLSTHKHLLALGINFDSNTKSVAEWKALPYQELLEQGEK